jgi:nitrite reductase/ring-hydroxylating ferredoxin subunit
MTAQQWHRIADLTQLGEGEPFPAEVEGRAVCLYKIDDGLHAVSDICPHQKNVRLSRGYFEGVIIECPMHQSCFDVRTGKVLAPPAQSDLESYDVKVENGVIFINLIARSPAT